MSRAKSLILIEAASSYMGAPTRRSRHGVSKPAQTVSARALPLLEADQHAVGAERQLQPFAARRQLHGHAVGVAQPERAASLVAKGPALAQLDIGAGEILAPRQPVDRPVCGQARGADAAEAEPSD